MCYKANYSALHDCMQNVISQGMVSLITKYNCIVTKKNYKMVNFQVVALMSNQFSLKHHGDYGNWK